MANPQEHELHYPLGDRLPASGEVVEVAPGVRWLRMALPFALDHINLWLLRDRSPDGRPGWAIVDCGIADDRTRQAWGQVFASGLDGLPVLRVIVTHMHPDHIGFADGLCEHWSTPQHPCRLWISATDWHVARMASQATAGFGGEASAHFFARHGLVDPQAQAQIKGRSNYYASMVPKVPSQFRRLLDGMTLTIGDHGWRCISGYGHAPEHIALYCDDLRVLISGDMLLPRISTNVSVVDLEPEADPLPLYLSSIDKFNALPAETLVLPSHGKPFHGIQARTRQLHQHHAGHFDDVLRACAEGPCSAHDLLPVLFRRPLDLHQTTFAMGEAVAHLHALLGRGLLAAETGVDAVRRFRTVAAPVAST